MTITLPSRYQNAPTRHADVTREMLDLYNVVAQINAGGSPTTKGSLDIFNMTASVAVPNTPTVITAPTINQQTNIQFDTATGIITLPFTGMYQFLFMLNINAIGAFSLFYGAEVDTGSGFTVLPYSGRVVAVPAAITGQILFSSFNSFPAGTRARIYIWASNTTTTFQTTALTALPSGGLNCPAVRVMITGESA